MPTTTYDRSKMTRDFEFTDLREAAQIELITGPDGKCWVNLNGRCLLRVGKCDNIQVSMPTGAIVNVTR